MSNPRCPQADVPGMMRAWTDIVAVGTALGIRDVALKGRAADPDDRRRRGARGRRPCRHPAPDPLSGGGRRNPRLRSPDGAVLRSSGHADILLSATLAEPPARVGRFAHKTEDYVGLPHSGQGGSSPIRPSARSSMPRASPPPSLPLAIVRGACRSASISPHAFGAGRNSDRLVRRDRARARPGRATRRRWRPEG